MEVKSSKFSLAYFLVEKSLIERKPKKHDLDPIIDISPSGILDKERNIFQLNLDVNITDNKGTYQVSVSAVALFAFKEIATLENISDYFFTNAPAIMFPFVRSYISALTALSGMNAIYIPIINMSSLKSKLQENTRVKEPKKSKRN